MESSPNHGCHLDECIAGLESMQHDKRAVESIGSRSDP